MIQSLAEAPLDRVGGRLRVVLNALAEAPPPPAIFRSAVKAVAEAPDTALGRWAGPAAYGLVEMPHSAGAAPGRKRLPGQEVSVDVEALTGRRVATVEGLVSLDRDAEIQVITLDGPCA